MVFNAIYIKQFQEKFGVSETGPKQSSVQIHVLLIFSGETQFGTLKFFFYKNRWTDNVLYIHIYEVTVDVVNLLLQFFILFLGNQ